MRQELHRLHRAQQLARATTTIQDAQALFIGVGGSTTQVSPGSASSGDEGARYLFNSDVDPNTAGTQSVITYTIGTYSPPAIGQIASMIATMKSMARQGGGSYYPATSIDKLADAFSSILAEIQGINSMFVSASLPVSVNTQGTFLNQVFLGMFRPDAGGSPKWLGNVKQYQLKYDSTTGDVRLADADGLDAVDASTGFVSVLARSYWTSSSTLLDQLGAEQDRNGERFQGRPRSAERRRRAAVARREPDDAGQPQCLYVRSGCHDRRARLRCQRPAVGDPVQHDDAESRQCGHAGGVQLSGRLGGGDRPRPPISAT